MSEETWHGIPRNKIPWYPTIDYEKCISCGKCVDYCTLGTYEFEEKDGKKAHREKPKQLRSALYRL